MDLPWGDEKTTQFVTNVGLITTDGPNGENVMACEWTHQVSYKPGLLTLSIGPNKATSENIIKSKEFGVSVCATDQSILSSIAGGNSGKNIDKIKTLEELGFKFYKAENIKTLMVEGAAANFECKLIKKIKLGDHTLFVGEVVKASVNKDKQPLVYHKGKYWVLEKTIQKPEKEKIEEINQIIEKFKK